MATLTDPARELADMCELLATANNVQGADHIATAIGVDAWSKEFLHFLLAVEQRFRELRGIIQSLDIDADYLGALYAHLQMLQDGFGGPSLLNGWQSYGLTQLNPTNITAIKMISPQVRSHVSYPRMTSDEIEEVLALIDDLEAWLSVSQLEEADFIRGMILDGIKAFRFRLASLKWFGWQYSMQSLRDVITAYCTLEGMMAQTPQPDATTALKKIKGIIQKMNDVVSSVRDVHENAVFAVLLATAAYRPAEALKLLTGP